MILNLSTFSEQQTARTCVECAQQRAFNIAALSGQRVLELMVGPSLPVLEKCYAEYGIEVWGNDIDPRYQKSYQKGKWIIGDARKIDTSSFDVVVIGAPLSKGCSGRREDSLSLEDVVPSYYQFLHLRNRLVVFVLPGRTLSIKQDRSMLFKFLSRLSGRVEIMPLVDRVVKYIDVYWVRDD